VTWEAFPELIEPIAGMVTAVAAAIAAVIAWRGLRTWQDEMLGRRRAELAEEILADFYQVRDVFRWVRSPAGFAEEAAERPRDKDENEDVSRQLDRYFVPLARLHADRALLSALHAKQYRFRAVFGEKVQAPFQELRTIEAEIVASARMLTRLAKADARKAKGFGTVRELSAEKLQEDLKRREQHEERIWDTGEEGDEIVRRLDSLVSDIEAVCRPAIEARRT